MNAADVQKKLRAKGQAMTLTRSVPGTYDPVTGNMTGGSTASYTLQGITTNYNSMTRLSAQMLPDSMIMAGDKQALVDAVTVIPLPGDNLTISGEVWKIIAVDASAPAGVPLLYKCQVRR